MSGQKEFWSRLLRDERTVFCRELKRGAVVATWSYFDTKCRVWRSPWPPGLAAVAELERQRESGELGRVAALVIDNTRVAARAAL